MANITNAEARDYANCSQTAAGLRFGNMAQQFAEAFTALGRGAAESTAAFERFRDSLVAFRSASPADMQTAPTGAPPREQADEPPVRAIDLDLR